MGAMNRTRWTAVAAVLSTLVVGACTSAGDTTSSPSASQSGPSSAASTSASGGCAVNRQLVPSCGVLLGVTTQDPSSEALQQAEGGTSRAYDFVYRFHDLSDTVPDADEKALVAAGRMLHISIDTKEHGAGAVANLTWAQVADGAADDRLAAQAKGIAALGAPVWVTFEHEADQPAKVALGTGAEFQRAWRHVREVFTKNGATNAVWVWVMMGTQAGITRAQTMWPGNDEVDWVSWDVYNPSGCRAGQFDGKKWLSFDDSLSVFGDWLTQSGPGLGIDLAKPVMISEAGSVADPNDPSRRANWYEGIAAALKTRPTIKAIGLWDHTGNNTCDYRYSGEPQVQSAIDTMMSQPELSRQAAAPTG